MPAGEQCRQPAADHRAQQAGGMMARLASHATRFARQGLACLAVSVLTVSILGLPILTGCGREGEAAQRPAGPASPARGVQSAVPAPSPQSGGPALVAHPGNIQAGLPAQHPLRVLANPREHDPRAAGEGKQLFVSYNCADCHGGDGSGGMGPSLQDGRWHFGGSAGEVYESISEGRPDGMPSWGGRISDSQIWALVAYVRMLSSGKDVTTQTFDGGGTVSRGGH
jgi:cytochrome c oxidase cbb3-type subunit III